MKQEFRLSVDYQQSWPLNDIMLPGPPIDWSTIITPELSNRLVAWARFFNQYMDWETGLFGSEERRGWYDKEGVALLYELERQAGHLFTFKLYLP